MSAPKDRKYTKTHEWALIDGDVVTIGLTDHAQQELGDITYLELPEIGDAVTASESFGVVESVKAASDVYAPVDGEVVERNNDLIDTPEVINQSPYDGAWLIKVKPGDPAQADSLMDPDTYDSFAAADSH